MNNLVILFGPSGSGKTTLKRYLVENYNYKPIISYTTRPRRENEKDEIDYHFISIDGFLRKIDEGFFFEFDAQRPNEKLAWYGTAKKDILAKCPECSKVHVLNYSGVRKIIKSGVQCKLVYLNEPDELCYQRLISRGESVEEIARRFAHDKPQFKDLEVYLNSFPICKPVLTFANCSIEYMADVITGGENNGRKKDGTTISRKPATD